MASTDLAAIDGILKDYYTDVFRDQLSMFSPLQDLFEKITDAQWEGRTAIEGVLLEYNEAVMALGEGANSPTAGSFKADQFKIPMKYVYATVQMTQQAIDAAKTSKGAFRNTFRTQMDTTVRNCKRERARMLWHAGTGALARVNATGTVTNLDVDDAGGVTGSFGGTRFLRKNMIVALMNGATLNDVVTLTGVTDSDTVTIASTAIADNDLIYRAAQTGSTVAADLSRNNEPMGLLGLIDDGTYVGTLHNLSRTTYPVLKSRAATSVGALSLDAIQQEFDYTEQIGDANISNLACHHAVRRAYLALLEADRRYTGDSLMNPDGGTVAAKPRKWVTFAGIPILTDKFAPYDVLFGIDKSDMKRYVQKEGEWAPDDKGAVLSRVSGKVDEWIAQYRIWENYHCSRPNTGFRMSGITTTKVFVPMY